MRWCERDPAYPAPSRQCTPAHMLVPTTEKKREWRAATQRFTTPVGHTGCRLSTAEAEQLKRGYGACAHRVSTLAGWGQRQMPRERRLLREGIGGRFSRTAVRPAALVLLACTVVGSKGETLDASHPRRHLLADVNGAIELTPDNTAGTPAATTEVRIRPTSPCCSGKGLCEAFKPLGP
jgi:hypothetical protein